MIQLAVSVVWKREEREQGDVLAECRFGFLES